MPAALRSIDVRAPGFYGLNTQDEAASLDPGWASELSNAVFDAAGRLASRKGYSVLTSSAITQVDRVFFWRKDRTTNYLLSTGIESAANKVYYHSGTDYETRNDITGTGNSGTDWHFSNVNGYVLGSRQGSTPIYWGGTGNFANCTLTAVPSGVTLSGANSCTAFGRWFCTDSTETVVCGSKLAPNPTNMDFSAWFIDLSGNSGGTAKDGWTFGGDYCTGLAAFQDRLVIFSTSSIAIYADINGTVVLTDAVTGIGCINQESIVVTENDVLFLSATGMRSLRRTLVYETSPLGNVSRHIRDTLMTTIDTDNAGAVYDPSEGQIVLFDQSTTSYYFDTKNPLPDAQNSMVGGSLRASLWTMPIRCADYSPTEERCFLGIGGDVCSYDSYTDDAAAYELKYLSSWQDFGTHRIKILKEIKAIFSDGNGLAPEMLWSYDFNVNRQDVQAVKSIPSPTVAEWNLAQFNIDEFGAVDNQITERTAEASESGHYVQYGVEVSIDGQEIGIQQMHVHAKLGRT